jgi:hypothetical protein
MVSQDDVLLAVPIGRENAVGVTKIEEIVGLRSFKKIRASLADLVASGQINSEVVPGARRHGLTIYYRRRL